MVQGKFLYKLKFRTGFFFFFEYEILFKKLTDTRNLFQQSTIRVNTSFGAEIITSSCKFSIKSVHKFLCNQCKINITKQNFKAANQPVALQLTKIKTYLRTIKFKNMEK